VVEVVVDVVDDEVVVDEVVVDEVVAGVGGTVTVAVVGFRRGRVEVVVGARRVVVVVARRVVVEPCRAATDTCHAPFDALDSLRALGANSRLADAAGTPNVQAVVTAAVTISQLRTLRCIARPVVVR
jgi:hypothetical protein